MKQINLLITDEGRYGLTAESPQLPGLSIARDTWTEFERDYKQIIEDVVHDRFATLREYRLVGHYQRHITTPEGVDCVVRWCTDDDDPPLLDARTEVAKRVLWALSQVDEEVTAERLRLLDGELPNILGDVVFACMAPGDTVGDALSTMYDQDDVVTIACAVGDQGLWIIQAASPMRDGSTLGWMSMEEAGISMTTTISELMMRPSRQRVRVAA